MRIYPAIDLYQGKVVRLEKGDYQKQKIYSENPAEVARNWVEEGASWLHVVDLEGAKTGEIRNWKALEQIIDQGRVSIQFGGGVRKKSDIVRLLKLGVQRVIVGTLALDRVFIKEVADRHGKNLALSLGVRDEEIQIQGWLRSGKKTLTGLFHELKDLSLACVVMTDIARDGTLRGLNITKVRQWLNQTPWPIIVSGGVATLDDLKSLVALHNPRLEGVIIGKALYERRFSLGEALGTTGEKT
jgi:phosphoribosylformimino-5-aminoimidazole carboxamide ribotide isomerase